MLLPDACLCARNEASVRRETTAPSGHHDSQALSLFLAIKNTGPSFPADGEGISTGERDTRIRSMSGTFCPPVTPLTTTPETQADRSGVGEDIDRRSLVVPLTRQANQWMYFFPLSLCVFA